MSLQNTLKALSDPIRREILNLLKGGRLSAGEITEHFSVTGAAISRHLSADHLEKRSICKRHEGFAAVLERFASTHGIKLRLSHVSCNGIQFVPQRSIADRLWLFLLGLTGKLHDRLFPLIQSLLGFLYLAKLRIEIIPTRHE